MKQTFLVLAALTLFYCHSATSVNADIVVNSAYDQTFVYDYNTGNYDSDQSYSLTGASTTSTIPGFTSTLNSVYNANGLTSSFFQTRDPGPGYWYGYGYNYVDFTANANDYYSASGIFNNTGDGYSQLYAYLYDYTAGQYLFWGYEGNYGAGTAILGSQSGNSGYYYYGSLTGSLVAGNNYWWYTHGYVSDYSGTGNGSVASGFSSLNISAVPEPTTIGLSMLGLLGFIGLRRRRR